MIEDLQSIKKDYGERRVRELLDENKIYGAIIICLDYPVSEAVMAEVLKKCSENNKIEIRGSKEGYRININTLGKKTIEGLLRIVLAYEDVGKKYKAIIERKQAKAL